MTVSVAWRGTGRQFTANIATDTVTVVKYRGSGGTPSEAAADGAKEGTTALTVTVNKTGICLFVAVPTALDFTGTELDQLVYVWGNFLAAGILATQADADGGFGICLSSGAPTTSNYSLFSFYGNDNYEGGWKRMVLDPTKARSAGVGTLTTSNITHIGVFANVGATTARFDNLLLDACDVGTGIRVFGAATLGLIAELLTNEATNAYGIVTSLNDSDTAVEVSGDLTLGDDVGVAGSTILDENSKIFAAEPLYYNGGIVAAAPLTYTQINLVGNGSAPTAITIGQVVGSSEGRNGWTVVGNSTYDVGFDRSDGNVSPANFYGTTLENLTGALALDDTHDFDSCTMVGCGPVSIASDVNNLTSVGSGQLTLTGTAKLIDSLLINNTATSAISTDDLAKVLTSSFTSDGSNHAVNLGTIAASTTQSWSSTLSSYVVGSSGTDVGVTPTGNEAILVSVSASQILTINVADGATIPSVANSGAGTVNVVAGLVTLSISTQTGNEVRIKQGSYTLQHNQNVSAGVETYSYTYAAGTSVTITVGAAGYERKTEDYILTTTDTTLLFTLIPSPSYI